LLGLTDNACHFAEPAAKSGGAGQLDPAALTVNNLAGSTVFLNSMMNLTVPLNWPLHAFFGFEPVWLPVEVARFFAVERESGWPQ